MHVDKTVFKIKKRLVILFCFEAGFHTVALAGLELAVVVLAGLSSQRSACLRLPSVAIKGVYVPLCQASQNDFL